MLRLQAFLSWKTAYFPFTVVRRALRYVCLSISKSFNISSNDSFLNRLMSSSGSSNFGSLYCCLMRYFRIFSRLFAFVPCSSSLQKFHAVILLMIYIYLPQLLRGFPFYPVDILERGIGKVLVQSCSRFLVDIYRSLLFLKLLYLYIFCQSFSYSY